VPGLTAALAVAAVATGLGRLLPLVGGPVFGIVLGAGVAAIARPGARLAPGLSFAGRQVLHASIVLLGTGLSLTQVLHVGCASLPVMLGTLAVALAGAWVVGRLLGVDRDTRTLIGVGTGICGASAIAAVTAAIDARKDDVAYAVGTIFTFNVVAVLLYPTVGHLLGLSQNAFGLWAGTAVNDTSSVVAAAYTYGQQAGTYAVVVKLTRALMIIPITVCLAYLHARRRARQTGGTRTRLPWRKVFPLFVVGFLATSALDTVGAIPAGWQAPLAHTGVFLITVALAGIGLSTRASTLRQAGHRPLLLGAVLWAAVGAASLLLQAATGTL
jgi:uncharacterized integral membrane protein (TIGR00698 family)